MIVDFTSVQLQNHFGCSCKLLMLDGMQTLKSSYYIIKYASPRQKKKTLWEGEITDGKTNFNRLAMDFVMILYTTLHKQIRRYFLANFGFGLFGIREISVWLRPSSSIFPFRIARQSVWLRPSSCLNYIAYLFKSSWNITKPFFVPAIQPLST